jgi:hypothetical protein
MVKQANADSGGSIAQGSHQSRWARVSPAGWEVQTAKGGHLLSTKGITGGQWYRGTKEIRIAARLGRKQELALPGDGQEAKGAGRGKRFKLKAILIVRR